MADTPIAGRYELLGPLGRGGMGDVWRGYDAVLDRPVAVKLIRRQSVTSPDLGQEFVKRFQREARVTARIRHPGVPQVYDAVLDDALEHLHLVMELVDGVPLTDCVDAAREPDGHGLPVSWAASVLAQVATVLSHAHGVPVVHRDLKPANILVAQDGTVKVLDFGIAAILRTDVTKLTATGSPLGSHHYMAPEQVLGGRITPQADLYALGCVLHELLSGEKVFTADSEYVLMYRHVNDAPTPLGRLRADVPRELEALVLHLLSKEPEGRPADVQEVYERLLPFVPPPGAAPLPVDALPHGLPDPTGLFRLPYAPRPRGAAGQRPASGADDSPAPAPMPETLRAEIREVHAHYDALMQEERCAQAAEVVGEVVDPAARALGADNKVVLGLRTRRAVSRLLGGDVRAALPEFDALAEAYARTTGPAGEQALDCRAQAARCRAELGEVTAALAELRAVLDMVRSVDGEEGEEALVLRRDIGMLLLAQGRSAEAGALLVPLHADLVRVLGPEDELTVEIAETLALVRLALEHPRAEE